MKQTSLIQSWTRAFNPAGSRRKCTSSDSDPHPVSKGHDHHLNDAFDSNIDDRVLADALDELDPSTNPAASTTDTPQLEEESVSINPSAIQALRKRKPLIYQPTANDSDQLGGFDLDAGRIWIYPTNATLRDYQFHIVEQCLYRNTLVCLPTGLGKTFIAAVVMYNFLRWYPTGKSVFLAPTRPLVAQQLSACLRLTCLSPNSMTELTGSIPQCKRRELWSRLRVFFLTPQVLTNDLEAGVCPASDLRLIVFDEAHKATGNHAYCQVLRLLTGPPYLHRQFRIIALSATPAADIRGVQTLIANLLISHLEVRTETSEDLKQFTQTRQLETVVVPLGPELRRFQNQLIACIRTPIERLQMRGAFVSATGDLRPERLAKYTVIKAREEWSNSQQASVLSPIDASSVQCDFGSLICLMHAMELLEQHGLRPLYQYLAGVLTGQRGSPSVRAGLLRLPGVSQLWSDLANRFSVGIGELSGTQSPFHGGHPKLDKLKQLLCEHFHNNSTSESRVIVFSQFRDSVEEIIHMLKQLRPLIRPACFMGQSSGPGRSPTLTGYNKQGNADPNSPDIPTLNSRINANSGVSQRDQLRVMSAFREGVFNTLVSTCVGEEGLDVGQVDLIVCFDAFKSPIRLVQRLGRTGRQRYGRIVMLLTEGREERNHQVSMARTTLIHKALIEGGALNRLAFYPHNPRMVPIGITPLVHFQNLNSIHSLCNESSDDHLVKEHSSKRKSTRSSKMRRTANGLIDSVRSHVEAVGLGNLNLNLTPIGPGSLLCLDNSTTTVAKPRFTDLFNVTCPKRLNAACEQLQAARSGSGTFGPATSTLHLISILRLCELHRRGLTRLSYHALGLRSVDVETPLSRLVAESDPPVTNSPKTPSPMVIKTSTAKESGSSDLVGQDNRSTELNTISSTFTFPRIIRGLVSNSFFFDQNVDRTWVRNMENTVLHFRSLSENENARIDLPGLQKAWTQHEANVVDCLLPICRQERCLPLVTPIAPIDHLEQWVGGGLLEAIANASDKPDGGCQPHIAASQDTPKRPFMSPKRILDSERASASLCLKSPVDLTVSNIVARSTPCVKLQNQHSRLVPSSVGLERNTNTQIKLEEALALLDRSTIRLDASTLLLEDDLVEPAPNLTELRSVVFPGTRCLSSSDKLQFDTKLSLGEDFGEDLLIQSQNIEPTDHQSNHGQSPFCGSQSPEHLSSFELPSQIAWSPVGFGETTPRAVESVSSSDESTPIVPPVHLSAIPTNLDSPIVPPRHRAENTKRARHLLQTQPTNRSSRRPLYVSGRQFLLTQANDGSHPGLGDSETLSSDGYENSFIDDRSSQLDVSSGQTLSSGLGNSDMLSVYLRTTRSPLRSACVPLSKLIQGPQHVKNRTLALNSRSIQSTSTKEGSPEISGTIFHCLKPKDHLIYSQTPEDDEYELDSFFVNSEESTPATSEDDSPRRKPTKRRRTIRR